MSEELLQKEKNTYKNSMEKQELFKNIWNIANDLRGKVSGWEFQSYVLGTIFYRYISEWLTKCINDEQHEIGDLDFDYAEVSDELAKTEKNIIITKYGFYIAPSELFKNVLKNTKNKKIESLSETLEKVFLNIEQSSELSNDQQNGEVFKGLFRSYDVNSISLGDTSVKRDIQLEKLLANISAIDFGNDFVENTTDMLGDAYEYLIGMYAANAGKSGGEYFTPQEVSELLTRIGLDHMPKKGNDTFRVYDPTCGSGSLLLKSRKILKEMKGVVNNIEDIEFFGQESNPTTYNLCRMNMILHHIKTSKIHIACDDTLIYPKHLDDVKKSKGFDLIVSNPPYSVKWIGSDKADLINDDRYSPAGVLAPKSKADLAFILHSLHHLNNTGKAAIVCFPGIMYRGGAEQKIREHLIKQNVIEAVIQLPSDLFFGTSIATSILVLNKAKKDNNILFVDASKEYYKDTNNNRLNEENINHILTLVRERKNKENLTALVGNEEVLNNGTILSVNDYVKLEELKEQVDIIQLNAEITEKVAKINQLRVSIEGLLKNVG